MLRAVREPLEQIYRRSETTDRINMRRALQRLLPCAPEIFDRLADVIAAAVMMRQLTQMIVQLLGEHRLQCVSGALVQEFAASNQQRVVGDLLRERMLENVLSIGEDRLLVDELGRPQIRKHALQLR